MIRIHPSDLPVHAPAATMRAPSHDSRSRFTRLILAAAALLGAFGPASCGTSARDEYMATRNIRIAPTEAGDEPGASSRDAQGVAGAEDRENVSDPR